MDLKHIVATWLKENEYDGLYSSDDNCACCIGDDFMPCDEPHIDCSPGYRVDCPAGHEFHFMITDDKGSEGCE